MVSELFRRQLRKELEQWWKDGLIDSELYQVLADRYQLQDIENAASQRFVAILMAVGGVLLGLGVITLVAANWQIWPRDFKVLVLLSLFVGVNAAGFYLWRRPPTQKGFQRLGHGLLLTGALVLGANVGLMSQMFHISGAVYELFLVWSLGVVAMAYSLRLTSLGVLALILMTLAYGSGMGDLFETEFDPLGWHTMIHHMPLVVSGLFIPLAYWCRSRVLFGLGACAIALSLKAHLWAIFAITGGGWLAGLAFGLPPALLWAYNDQVATPSPKSFPAIARSVAIVILSISIYFFSFHWWWSEDFSPSHFELDWSMLIDLLLLGSVALWGWLRLSYQLRHVQIFQTLSINSGLIAGCIGIPFGIFVWQFTMYPLDFIAAFTMNALLFLLAIGLIRDGLSQGERRAFWGGIALLVMGILSRSLEFNTGLLVKALLFVLCGVGIIAAGLWFERNIKPNAVSSHSSNA